MKRTKRRQAQRAPSRPPKTVCSTLLKCIMTDAPMALGTDGSITVNIRWLYGNEGFLDALERAAESKATLFVGLVLTNKEAADARKRFEQIAPEIAAFSVGRRLSPPRTPRR